MEQDRTSRGPTLEAPRGVQNIANTKQEDVRRCFSVLSTVSFIVVFPFFCHQTNPDRFACFLLATFAIQGFYFPVPAAWKSKRTSSRSDGELH